jgi:formylglycine-generating enzyme required for sulfatase activity
MSDPTTVPAQLGRYRILSLIGEGGMGAVYLAEDTKLGRKVALKVPHFKAADGPAVIERFKREARAAAAIGHPHLCPVFDVGELNGVHFLVMPYIEGTPLSRLLAADGPWEVRRVAALVRQLALAVEALHQRGLIHRDLKPGNVLIRPNGEPMLMDFGLARFLSEQGPRLTNTGAVLGTPAYMAPEQILGDLKALGPATDVYELGVILYELLTGGLPFVGPPVAVYGQILHAQPERPSVRRPGLDAAIDAVCLKALAKKPEERFASMADLADALAAYLERHPEITPNTVSYSPSADAVAQAAIAPEERLPDNAPFPSPANAPPRQLVNTLGMDFVRIEPGTFLMGSPDGTTPRGVQAEEERGDDEAPHRVTLTKGYYLGACLVTQHQWEAVLGKDANFSLFKGKYDAEKKLPVDNVTWFDCVDFCIKLSEKEKQKPCYRMTGVERNGDGSIKAAEMEFLEGGTGYRLPTEAEWEYACRAGTKTTFWWGNTISPDRANYDCRVAYGKDGKTYEGRYRQQTTPVDQFEANPWGLFDIHGNLWQWCQDWYRKDCEKDEKKDPQGPNSGDARVLRGGSWIGGPGLCRVAYRRRIAPYVRYGYYGCRLLLRLD